MYIKHPIMSYIWLPEYEIIIIYNQDVRFWSRSSQILAEVLKTHLVHQIAACRVGKKTVADKNSTEHKPITLNQGCKYLEYSSHSLRYTVQYSRLLIHPHEHVRQVVHR